MAPSRGNRHLLCLRYSHGVILSLVSMFASCGEPSSALLAVQEDEVMERTVTKKLHWHIMTRFCLLTFLNHMDRANLVRNLSLPTPNCHCWDIGYLH